MNHAALKAIVFAGLIATQVNVNQALAGIGDSITNWTWMKGDNTKNQSGTYGIRGVPDIGNKPGARNYAISWKDSGNVLWLFGGWGFDASRGSGRLSDLWNYDPATTNWTWVKGSNITNQNGAYGTRGVSGPDNMPGGREGAVTWKDSSGVLWLFGGYGYDSTGSLGYLNDLWKYDPATTNWTWIKGAKVADANGTYGTAGVPAANNTPGAREYAVSWMDSLGALWLFGGYGHDKFLVSADGNLNDLWKYDPATTNWTWMKGANMKNQTGTYGIQNTEALANTPGGRQNAVSWTDGSGALWLFSGYGYPASGASGYLNDLWKYNPTTTNWAWIKGSAIINQPGTYGTLGVPVASNMPGARWSAVSWTDGSGALWLFGGEGYGASGGMDHLNDLWKYNPASTNWTWVKGSNITNQPGIYGTPGTADPVNTPGGRRGAVSWADGLGTLWLFGGEGRDSTGSGGDLSDLWKYDVFAGGISLDTNALVFSATCQNVNPAAQSVGLTNVGGRQFAYTNVITYSAGAAGWLTVLPANGTVALNGAIVLTNQVNISGLGAGTYYATNQVTAPDAINSPQTVVVTLTVIGRADPTVVVNSLWYIWFSGQDYNLCGGPWNLGVAGTPVAADFDGDGLADPTMVVNSLWYIWFSGQDYTLCGGPWNLGVAGTPVAADFDGDGLADPTMVVNSLWYIWFSGQDYTLCGGPWNLGVAGTPVAADFDGDRLADPTMVVNSLWYIWFSGQDYTLCGGPWNLGVAGTPVAADFDGDGLADPTMVVNALWYIWFSGQDYNLCGGPWNLGVAGTPLAADFDGQ